MVQTAVMAGKKFAFKQAEGASTAVEHTSVDAGRAEKERPVTTLRDLASRGDLSADALNSGSKRSKKMLAAVKALSPLFCAMICRPGMAATAKEKGDAAVELLRSAQTSANAICQKIFPGRANDAWFVSQIQSAVAALISESWRKGLGAKIDGDIDAMSEALGAISDDDAASLVNWDYTTPKSEAEAISLWRLSLIKASAPIASDIKAFPFWKSGDASELLFSSILERVGNMAIGKTKKAFGIDVALSNPADRLISKSATLSLAAESADSQSRLMTLQSITGKAFQFASEEYTAMAKAALAEAKSGKNPAAVRDSWAKKDVADMVVSNTDKALTAFLQSVDRYIANADMSMIDSRMSLDSRQHNNGGR